MELSFIIAAIRRYIWVVYLCALLGLAAGLLIPASRADSFAAEAALIVRPPATEVTDAEREGTARYIESQVVVLESDDLANEVAQRLDLPFETVEPALTVLTDASSDVITLTASAGDAETAIRIANGYASQFLERRADEIRERNTTLIEIIDAQLGVLNSQQADALERLTDLPIEATNDRERIEQAQIAQEITNLNAEVAELISQKTTLEFAADTTSRDEVAATAVSATAEGTNSPLLTVAGTFAGALLGIAAVVTYAGASGRLLDPIAVEEALGTPVVGVFERASSFMPGRGRIKSPTTALEALPDRSAAVIDELCVRTEAAAPGPGTLLVVVTGTQTGAGTTTTALAMAGRLSITGARVLVIDADFSDPRITNALVGEHPGITDFLEEREHNEELTMFGPNGSATTTATHTDLAHLTLTHEQTRVGVIGIGTREERKAIQRSDDDYLIASLRNAEADVVLVDAGPMLKSAASVRLSQVADVTVLAVPYRRQDVEPLRVVRRLLADSRSTVLPIATEPR